MKTAAFLFFTILSFNLFSQQVNVTGTVKLKNQTDYTKILVIFKQLSPGISTDTVYSDSGGKYSFSANQGLYDVDFYKQGFDRITYKNIQLFSDKTLADTTLSLHKTYLSVPADFDSVYKAVNYAVTGDTIIISEGVYKEKISILKKGLTIASKYFEDNDTTHFSKTILNGEGKNQIMNISSEGETNKISGITFTDGYSKLYGGAISCIGNLTISNCRFINNRAVSNSNATAEGGAIYISGGDLNVDNTKFIKCSTSTSVTTDGAAAGAVSIKDKSATFLKCDFIQNTTLLWGAIYSSGYTIFDSCTFIGNKSTGGSAGALFIAGTKAYLSLKNSYFTDNSGYYVLCSWNNLGYQISNTLFKKNFTCVLYFINSKGITENSIFTENYAKGRMFADGITPYNNCQFSYNTAGNAFEGNFSNCIFYKNKFTNNSTSSKVQNSSLYPKSQFTFSDPLIGLLMKINVNKDSCDFYNNLIVNPCFVDTISFIPTDTSSLIDAGKNESSNLSIDYLGNHRFFDGNNDSIANVDIGPYEVKSTIIKQLLIPLGNDIVKCMGDAAYFTFPDSYYKTVWLNDTTYGNSKKVVKPGLYYLKTLYKGFLLFSDTIKVSDIQLPTVEITKTFVNDTIVKLQTSNTYSSYFWNDSSRNESINIPKSKFVSNELYSWVYVTDNNNCGNADTIKLLKADFPKILGISDTYYGLNDQIKIFPLPAFDKIFINYPDATNDVLKISIYDLSGKIAFTKNVAGSKELSIDISVLKSGNYIICLAQGNKKISRSISKL